ncbi:YaaR family protein [Clostridium arbusti]|uniref:YaaR family protein n=1 Tax=Clostridium arbusti TaxID=1137848 RepID=UPI0002893CC5|nr:YaaR family protein [Clostridium arbusti]
MEVSRIRNRTTMSQERKKVDSKKNFSQNFNFERDRRNEDDMKELLDDIKKRGNRLVISKCYADVKIYKNLIKEYLQGVLDCMYKVKNEASFWQTQYYITVDVIDKKLEEITEAVISEEKGNLDIASTIDDIQGLIVDIYK